VPDEVYENVRPYLPEKEQVALTLAIVAINGCNGVAIAFRAVPRTFKLYSAIDTKDAIEAAPAVSPAG
jgi:hypothetical protein